MKKIRGLKDGMVGKIGIFVNDTQSFIPEETEEKFKLICQTQPNDWLYKTEQVTYTYNQYGHRSIEIDDLKQNYFLFAGCSHTEGIGLKLENTYSYLVSKHYNKTFYNLGIGGSGPYLTMFNILGFLSKVKHKPSIVIIQWPNFNRYFDISIIHHNYYQMSFYQPQMNDEYYQYLLKNDVPLKHNYFYRQILLQNLRNMGIANIIESPLHDVFEQEDETIKAKFGGPIIDKARDLCHGGNLTNELWANEVINAINKNFAHVI